MTGPSRVIFLRHAEEHGAPGVTEDGTPDDASLTIRGWQRAGALCRLECLAGGADAPATVCASAIAPGSETKRPQQTAAPFVALRRQSATVDLVTRWAKGDVEELMADVLGRSGTVAVVWEHSRLPDCVSRLPGFDAAIGDWPKDRYDLLWILDKAGSGWRFSSQAQLLLPGDRHV